MQRPLAEMQGTGGCSSKLNECACVLVSVCVLVRMRMYVHACVHVGDGSDRTFAVTGAIFISFSSPHTPSQLNSHSLSLPEASTDAGRRNNEGSRN